jgi:uncharacterized Zn-binding protein involved in type VI secretion
MPPAARVGDMTAHGTPLAGPGAGSLTVFVGKKPAWRAVVDAHTCPLTSGTVPHVGGVARGSTTVFINGSPAARQGDTITEGGPPNAIAVGLPTVLIGG